MKWPAWTAVIFVAIQFALLAAAVIRRDSELGMLAGLLAPFTLLAVGFAVILRNWKGRKGP
ncbi:MAG: hypothetical protein M3552_22590 [Planctomycetota bacterium]|nr:hypothetical protein [Planctomycetaceae bacterium]MDQ3333397.1 hypothetical protein [Planctomycetota bacterium]